MSDRIETKDRRAEEQIKVSVIMPIYNAYDYLRPAMDSVLGQTLREIELICIDDGSNDGSFDLIREYQKSDSRIRVVTEANAGPSVARNNGLRRARGEYIAFLDADDFFEPEMLEKLYRLASAEKLDIAIGRYDLYVNRKAIFRPNIGSDHGEIYEGGRVTSGGEYPNEILSSTTGYLWNKIFRRRFIEEINLTFPGEIRVFEDVYFTVSALALAERIAKCPEILVHHRVYSEQARNKMMKKYYTRVPDIYANIKEFMMHNGMYAPLSKGFLNLSASRCYKLYHLLSPDRRAAFWRILHEDYAERLGWTEHAAEDYENQDVAAFCADVELYSYERYLREKAAGTVSLRRAKALLESFRRSKRLKAFLHGLNPFSAERRAKRRARREAKREK